MNASDAGAAVEFELKFHVEDHQQAAVAAAVERGRSRKIRLLATYFDTPDGALAERRLGLRIRREGKQWFQTAKGPSGNNDLQRLEHNVELAAPQTDAATTAPRASRRHGGGGLMHRAIRHAGHDCAFPPLVPLFATDVRRLSRDMRTGNALVELAFDRGDIRGRRTLAGPERTGDRTQAGQRPFDAGNWPNAGVLATDCG